MINQLERAIKIARQTGDKIIIVDTAVNNAASVVMNLDEYEKLLLKKSDVFGLTEQELNDKINRDIAIWRSEQESAPSFNFFDDKPARFSDNWPTSPIVRSGAENEPNAKKPKRWSIPAERRQAADEVLGDDVDPDDEDRQYLEEVRF